MRYREWQIVTAHYAAELDKISQRRGHYTCLEQIRRDTARVRAINDVLLEMYFEEVDHA